MQIVHLFYQERIGTDQYTFWKGVEDLNQIPVIPWDCAEVAAFSPDFVLFHRDLSILDALTGGRRSGVGAVADAIAGDCANMIFMKFNRAAEAQADAEGARMMAAAGYDPRDMANFFERLGEQSGERTTETPSDHPDPASRVAALDEIIPTLRLAPSPARDTDEFRRVRSRLAGMR